MHLTTLELRESPRLLTVTLHRPQQQNSINAAMVRELGQVLDYAEARPDCRAVVLQGGAGVFCTGMDFTELAAGAEAEFRQQSAAFMALLRRLTLTPRIVVAQPDGRVAGGGVGLVAASDLVVATPRSQFSLPEALWGLLPCCVLPYLIRRVGFQRAYRMALTTQPVGAAEARECMLVDELSEQPGETIRRMLLRALRVEAWTVADLKQYFRRMWLVSEQMEQGAVDALCELVARPRVQENIAAFVQDQAFPWERRNGDGADG